MKPALFSVRAGLVPVALPWLTISLPAQPAITNVVDVNTRQVLSRDGGRTWLDGGGSSRGSSSFGGHRPPSGPSPEQLRWQRQRELGEQEYQQGLARLQQGDFAAARAFLYSAMERRPDDPKIPKALSQEEKREAQAAAAKENWTWALTLYEYASHHNPDDPEIAVLWEQAKRQSKVYYDQRSDALANERIRVDVDRLTAAVVRLRSEPVLVGGGTIRFRSAGDSLQSIAARNRERSEEQPDDDARALAAAGFSDIEALGGKYSDVKLRGLARVEAWVDVPEELEKESELAAMRTERAMAAGEVVALQASLGAIEAERQRGVHNELDRGELDARQAALSERLEKMRGQTAVANAKLGEAVRKRGFYVAPISK